MNAAEFQRGRPRAAPGLTWVKQELDVEVARQSALLDLDAC